MDARVVFVFGFELTVSASYVVNGPRSAFHEFSVTLGVIEVDERKRFVGKDHRGPAIDYVMDKHFPIAQPVTKLFDVIGRAEREVVVRQPNAWLLRPSFQFSQQISDVETKTHIEIWLVEMSIKLEHLAPRPGIQIEVMRHGGRL